jgi:hypothetical protein
MRPQSCNHTLFLQIDLPKQPAKSHFWLNSPIGRCHARATYRKPRFSRELSFGSAEVRLPDMRNFGRLKPTQT